MDTTTALAARRAPLEYWFLKFNVPGLAFLVDLIARPTGGEVRLSLWLDGRGRVIHAPGTADLTGDRPRVGASSIGAGASSGAAGGIEWDLRYELGPVWVDPGRVLRAMRVFKGAFDLELVSAPTTRFSGRVTVDGRVFTFDDVPGLVAHYWGARLPPRWHWFSVNTPSLDVDAIVSHSRLWGLPGPTVAAGYLYVDDRSKRRMIVSPLNGVVRASGLPGDVADLTAWSPSGRTRLRFSAPRAAFNDLGEGILQTLVGTLEIAGERHEGIAGIEIRG